MGTKGDRTKEQIRGAAGGLFARRGFKDVTMKDICEESGLSRGGLYRHYESTGEIFQEIVHGLLDKQNSEFTEKIEKGMPALQILEDVLRRYRDEMQDSSHSLSLAIYEFYSGAGRTGEEHLLSRQYEASKKMWVELIRYGIRTKQFRETDPEAVYDLLVFAYQGVRMYSRLMPLDPGVPDRVLGQIKGILLL